MTYVSGYSHNRLFVIYFVLLSFQAKVLGQLSYHVEGKYAGVSAQGMAIYKNSAILLNNTGLCRVYDLKNKLLLSTLKLGSYHTNNHASVATFGVEKYGIKKMPVIYISEWNKPYRCFVESLNDTTSTLLQTIRVKPYNNDSVVGNWIVDRGKRRIYTVTNGPVINKKNKDRIRKIIAYRLPQLEEGEFVNLTSEDVVDSFYVTFPNVLQGGTIKGKYLYLPTGLDKSQSKREDSERTIYIVNLKTHQIVRKIDLTNITDNEPEDCDFYKGKLLLYCGQSGGLYEIPTK